jgi:hypothetical protein
MSGSSVMLRRVAGWNFSNFYVSSCADNSSNLPRVKRFVIAARNNLAAGSCSIILRSRLAMKPLLPVLFSTMFAVPGVFSATLEAQQKGDPIADPQAVVTIGNARFTVLTPQLVRMEWSEAGQWPARQNHPAAHRHGHPQRHLEQRLVAE